MPFYDVQKVTLLMTEPLSTRESTLTEESDLYTNSQRTSHLLKPWLLTLQAIARDNSQQS